MSLCRVLVIIPVVVEQIVPHQESDVILGGVVVNEDHFLVMAGPGSQGRPGRCAELSIGKLVGANDHPRGVREPSTPKM